MANNKIVKDFTNGRLLFYCANVLSATLNRTGWHNGSDIDGLGACRQIKIEYDTTKSYFTFKLTELDGYEFVIGYIAKKRGGAIPTDYVSYWNMDEGSGIIIDDKGVGGHDGTFVQETPGDITWSNNGKQNNCVQFNSGINSYINIPGHADFNFTTAMSLSYWMKTGWSPPPDPDPTYVYMVLSTGNANLSFMSYYYGAPIFKVYFVLSIGGFWNGATGIAVNDNLWHHIVGTFDGTNVKIYIDNVLIETVLYPGSIDLPGANSYIRFGMQKFNFNYQGLIDEIYLFNRELTITEIDAMYKIPNLIQDTPGFDSNIQIPNNGGISIGKIDTDEIINFMKFYSGGEVIGYIATDGCHDGKP